MSNGRSGATSQPEGTSYTGRVIVRLKREFVLQLREGLQSIPDVRVGGEWRLAASHELRPALDTVRSRTGELIWGPLVHAKPAAHAALRARDEPVPPAELLRPWRPGRTGIVRDSTPRTDVLDSYLVLQGRARLLPTDAMRAALAELKNLPQVGAAYPELVLREPCWAVRWSDDPCVPHQGYLEGEGVGVNARHRRVWGCYDGGSVKFVDIERGWKEHPDLPSLNVVHGFNHQDGEIHGAKTIGVIAALDNDVGIVGLAPKAQCAGLVSRTRDRNNQWELTEAIYHACGLLDPGDVLLLEVETVAPDPNDPPSDRPARLPSGLPVEVADHWFEAIRYATADRGIVVIEPAGNGIDDEAVNLDELDKLYSKGTPGLRDSLERDGDADSGAVVVSGCRSALENGHHRHLDGLNFGSRVDCYGWGEGVFTTHGDGSERCGGAYGYYGHTSAASAVVAGVAILVQDMARRIQNAPLSPSKIRDLLSDRSTGTPVVLGNGPVGVLPDLAKLESRLAQEHGCPSWALRTADCLLARLRRAVGGW